MLCGLLAFCKMRTAECKTRQTNADAAKKRMSVLRTFYKSTLADCCQGDARAYCSSARSLATSPASLRCFAQTSPKGDKQKGAQRICSLFDCTSCHAEHTIHDSMPLNQARILRAQHDVTM